MPQLQEEPDTGSAWLLQPMGKCEEAEGWCRSDLGAAFFCRYCLRTVSLLPSFALSYRLVQSELVERFILGRELAAAELRWEGLLKAYRKRAQQFCAKLLALVGLGFGVAPPLVNEVVKLVDWLTRLCGGLGPATEQLVNRWAITLFGIYRCHQRSVGLRG